MSAGSLTGILDWDTNTIVAVDLTPEQSAIKDGSRSSSHLCMAGDSESRTQAQLTHVGVRSEEKYLSWAVNIWGKRKRWLSTRYPIKCDGRLTVSIVSKKLLLFWRLTLSCVQKESNISRHLCDYHQLLLLELLWITWRSTTWFHDCGRGILSNTSTQIYENRSMYYNPINQFHHHV